MNPWGTHTPARSERRHRAGRMLPRALAAGAGFVWGVLWPESGLTHVTTTNTVVFEREIVGILGRHCADCHAPGRPGAPLMNYEDVWLAREDVLASVLARRMPPWSAVAGYGEFANENALTLREKQFLVSWVEGLGPRNAGEVFLNLPGSAGDTEAAAPGTGGEAWELGEPALVLELPETAPRGGADGGAEGRIQRVVLDPELAEDRGLSGVEYNPADRASVRAASFFLERTGRWLGSWSPWHPGTLLPPSVAHTLRAGDRVVAEILYGPGGEGAVTAGRIGLHLTAESQATTSPAVEILLEAREGTPAGDGLTRIHAEAMVGRPVRILALHPSRERGVRSLEVSARLPDGRTEILLLAQDLPYGWPTPYLLAEPVQLEGGSTLRATAYYENAEPAAARLRIAVSAF